MKAKFVGLQRIHFVNNNGEEVIGSNIFCLHQDENTEGFRASKFFLKEGISLPDGIKLNDTIEIHFNMKGKVESIEL